MRTIILILVYISSMNVYGQTINVKDFGAKGDGKTDDTNAVLKAVNSAKQNFTSKKQAALLYFPSGTYLVNRSINCDKYLSISGEFTNTSIIRMMASDQELIILENIRDESIIYNSYNYIKNISLQGPVYSALPLTARNISNAQKSIGIKVYGLRTRIQDIQIDGFLTTGIDIRASYYTYINNAFIKNNGVGILADEMSTSTYITNNEFRFNSIAIIIRGNSFANFINNNMIESNIGKFINFDTSENFSNTNSGGRGIIIKNAEANIITSNYFENQFVNITIENSNQTQINNNFIAISDNNVTNDKTQVPLQIIGNSSYNQYQNNSYLTTKPGINANKIIIGTDDLSTNTINVGADNIKLKGLFNTKQKDSKRQPTITN